jgi:hypothetical protein
MGYTIPLQIMRGAKGADLSGFNWIVSPDWAWTNPQYSLNLPVKLEDILTIAIDPSERMADIERINNVWNNSANAK